MDTWCEFSVGYQGYDHKPWIRAVKCEVCVGYDGYDHKPWKCTVTFIFVSFSAYRMVIFC